jgi:hypothetical protein
MKKNGLTQLTLAMTLIFGLMTNAQAASYTCFQGKEAKASKVVFKINEIPENKTFIFEYFQDKQLVLSNKKNATGSEFKLAIDGSNAKIFTHNSANMTVKIYPTQLISYGIVKGEFNFYQPKVGGDQFISLNCLFQ